MKHPRLSGLVAMGAALAVLAGATTASAETTELFAGATTLSSGTELVISMAPGSDALMESTSGSLLNTCTESSAKGTTENTTGTTVSGTGNITQFGGCSITTHTSANGSFSTERIAGTNDGTVLSSGTVAQVTISGVTCLYGTGGGTHLGKLDGVTSGHATVAVNAVINEREPKKILCPDTTNLTMSIVVTSPTGLNVGS